MDAHQADYFAFAQLLRTKVGLYRGGQVVEICDGLLDKSMSTEEFIKSLEAMRPAHMARAREVHQVFKVHRLKVRLELRNHRRWCSQGVGIGLH